MSWTASIRSACAAAALVFAMAEAATAAAPPPNIVLIISDDQGYADYSFMGHPRIKTPHIDRLAAQSLTFRRGHVPSSLCSPSLASILTGLYPHQHGVTSNDPPLPEGKTGRAAATDSAFLAGRETIVANFDKVPTLPRLLGSKGYVSFQAGKWWGGNFKHGGFTDGMSHGDPAQGGRHGDDGLKIGREGMAPVFKFIDDAHQSKKPFFLWYAPMMPHSPHTPPDRLLQKYKKDAPSLEIAKYWAMCAWFDETCGQLLDHLDKAGIAKNTLVAYVCDNGWIQDPKADRYAPRSKQSPYEGGLRTPIMIRWPGHADPYMAEDLVLSIDLAPTILTAAGLDPTPEMQGINLMDRAAVEGRKIIFGEIFTHNAVDLKNPASSLRDRWAIEGFWKLVVPSHRNAPDEPIELFDLARDPGETTNLAPRQPATIEHIKKLMDAWWPGDDHSAAAQPAKPTS